MEQIILSLALLVSIGALLYTGLRWAKSREENMQLRTLLSEREQALAGHATTQQSAQEFERQAITLEAKLNELHTRFADYEKQKEESLKLAKAAMFDSGKEVFNQEAKSLQEHFEKVSGTVAALHKQVSQQGARVDTVWQTLSNPHSAGAISEIGLENTLKTYGLEAGRDFFMQYHLPGDTGGTGLRPDAVVFLPANNIIVIDSKASKFFMELAQTADAIQQQEIKQKLQKRMDEHLRALASKGYKDATIAELKRAGRREVGHVFLVMFVHTESMIDTLHGIHPEFRLKCSGQDVILSGPAGLSGLLSMARFEILKEKQTRNYELILEELRGFLDSVEVTLNHVARAGKGLWSAAGHFEKLIASVNSNFLPKARRIEKLGVDLPRSKQLPFKLTTGGLLTQEQAEREQHMEAGQPMLQDAEE